jgi:hypothetical protein
METEGEGRRRWWGFIGASKRLTSSQELLSSRAGTPTGLSEYSRDLHQDADGLTEFRRPALGHDIRRRSLSRRARSANIRRNLVRRLAASLFLGRCSDP